MTMGDTVGMHTNPGETSMREAARLLSFLPTSHCLFCLCFSDQFAKIPKLPEKTVTNSSRAEAEMCACVYPSVRHRYHSSKCRPDEGADPCTLGSTAGSPLLLKLCRFTLAEHVDLHEAELWAREQG